MDKKRSALHCINFRVTTELLGALDAECEKIGISRKKYMEELLTEHLLEKNGYLYDSDDEE